MRRHVAKAYPRQRCLVVCPGSVADQWQDELYCRFQLPFEILTNDIEPSQRKRSLAGYARDAEARTLELFERSMGGRGRSVLGETIQRKLFDAVPRDIEELLPQLEPRAAALAALAIQKLDQRGAHEEKNLHETLGRQRERVREELAKQKKVSLAWVTLSEIIDGLKRGEFEKAVVLANRYDGIDLPDDDCRILVFDSKPYSESLTDLYQEFCRPDSEATLMRTIRTVEQGMGRSVRGEKDYCVVVVIGTDIIRLIRDKESSKYLSSQMAAQIELGLEIADMARQEIEDGAKPADAFNGLIRQCLGRDADWKAFYVEQMGTVRPSGANEQVLRLYATCSDLKT